MWPGWWWWWWWCPGAAADGVPPGPGVSAAAHPPPHPPAHTFPHAGSGAPRGGGKPLGRPTWPAGKQPMGGRVSERSPYMAMFWAGGAWPPPPPYKSAAPAAGRSHSAGGSGAGGSVSPAPAAASPAQVPAAPRLPLRPHRCSRRARPCRPRPVCPPAMRVRVRPSPRRGGMVSPVGVGPGWGGVGGARGAPRLGAAAGDVIAREIRRAARREGPSRGGGGGGWGVSPSPPAPAGGCAERTRRVPPQNLRHGRGDRRPRHRQRLRHVQGRVRRGRRPPRRLPLHRRSPPASGRREEEEEEEEERGRGGRGGRGGPGRRWRRAGADSGWAFPRV